MKISSINNIQNIKSTVKNLSKVNKPVQPNVEMGSKNPVNAQLYQAYNNISFKALNVDRKQGSFQHLSANGKDYLYLNLPHFDDPIIVKPNSIDTYFRDKAGNVCPAHVEDFIYFYNKFYDDEMSVSDSIISFSKELIEQADEKLSKSPELNLPKNVIPFNLKKEKINYYTEQNKIKETARAYMYNEAENKKKFPIVALDKAFMLMQLSKEKDGYFFFDFEKKKPIINELFMVSDKTQFDFKTPIINASKDEEGIVDLDLLKLMLDFMYEINWQACSGFEEIASVLKTLKSNPQNDMASVIKHLANLSDITIARPKEFEYVANQCINKETNEFNVETFATIINLYTESEFLSSFFVSDFSDESMQKYEQIESELVHSYLQANNDEQTATIREDADSIMRFAQEFLENKKEELN